MVISVGSHKLVEFSENVELKHTLYKNDKNVHKAIFYNNDDISIFSMFGRGAENKEIPLEILQLPLDDIKIFLDGYLSGDGNRYKNIISATTVSKKLAINIQNIMYRVYGLPSSITINENNNKIIEGRVVNSKPLYTIKITQNPTKKMNYVDGNYCWGKLQKLSSKKIEVIVYNLSVENDESYIANNTIVHNCTYLTVTGNKWYYHPEDKELPIEDRRPHPNFPNRANDREDAVEFFQKLMDAPIEQIAIENPIGIISTRIRKPEQIIQPYNFGDPHAKKTCLWLKGFKPLRHTEEVEPEYVTFKSGKRMAKWYVDAAKLPPKERACVRSKTFEGIANAMVNQWFKNED
jgi:hypothetical protein